MHPPARRVIALLAFAALLLRPEGSSAQLPEKPSAEQCQKAIDSYSNEMKLVGTVGSKESLDRAYDATARLSDVLTKVSPADKRVRDLLSDACESFLGQADDAVTKGAVDRDHADELAKPVMAVLVEITGQDARSILRRLDFINSHTRKSAPGAYGFDTHRILYENIYRLELLSRELRANIGRPPSEQVARIPIETDTPAMAGGVHVRVPPRDVAKKPEPLAAPSGAPAENPNVQILPAGTPTSPAAARAVGPKQAGVIIDSTQKMIAFDEANPADYVGATLRVEPTVGWIDPVSMHRDRSLKGYTFRWSCGENFQGAEEFGTAGLRRDGLNYVADTELGLSILDKLQKGTSHRIGMTFAIEEQMVDGKRIIVAKLKGIVPGKNSARDRARGQAVIDEILRGH